MIAVQLYEDADDKLQSLRVNSSFTGEVYVRRLSPQMPQHLQFSTSNVSQKCFLTKIQTSLWRGSVVPGKFQPQTWNTNYPHSMVILHAI